MIEVMLLMLFEFCKLQDGQKKQLSCILICGWVGIGKIILYKKIIYNFIYNNLQQGLFNCVFQVLLWNLKVEKRQSVGYNFWDLFYYEYFF